jgi:hypothetical protein
MKITYEGKEYTLTQDPYASGNDEQEYYEALAIDSDRNVYSVIWHLRPEIVALIEEWEDRRREARDESKREPEPPDILCGTQEVYCDWDNPYDVIPLHYTADEE